MLAPNHLMSLRASGLEDSVIKARGYFTESDPKKLKSYGFSDNQLSVPTLVIPVHGIDGDIVGYQHRPDEPRMRDGKPLKYETPAGFKMRLDTLHSAKEAFLNPRQDLWITEGIKKADAATYRGYPTVALLGVWNFRGKNSHGGICDLADWSAIPLNGRTIHIAFDSDVTTKYSVQLALRALVKMLRRKGAHIIVHLLPEETKGLDDYIVAGGNLDALPIFTSFERKRVKINGRQARDILADFEQILTESQEEIGLFNRGGELVVLHENEFRPLTSNGLLRLLHDSLDAYTVSKDGQEAAAAIPKLLAEQIMAEARLEGLRDVVSVISYPVVTASGLVSEGYDEYSQLLVLPTEVEPWDGSATDALEFIAGILKDFPFESQADLAGALALLFEPIVRPLIKGVTPLHLINAPSQRSGKSLLAKVLMIMATGKAPSARPFYMGRQNEAKFQEELMSGLAGGSVMFFDDVSCRIESDLLNKVLTSKTITARKLHTQFDITRQNRHTWILTGNNPEISTDIAGRTSFIRINPRVERPGSRTGFAIADIEEYAESNRPVILGAILAIVKDWIEKGKPKGSAVLGGFQQWASTLSGILESVGVEGFLDNAEMQSEQADSDTEAAVTFLAQAYLDIFLFQSTPAKPSDLLASAIKVEEMGKILGPGNERSQLTRLGHWLKKMGGKVFEGYDLLPVRNQHTKGLEYVVEKRSRNESQGPAELQLFSNKGDLLKISAEAQGPAKGDLGGTEPW